MAMWRSAFAALGAASAEPSLSLNSSVQSVPHMCPGSSIVDASSAWVWDASPASPSPSCMSPPATNPGRMCADDPTSIVLQSHGNTGCYVTKMRDCKFSMYDLQQLDFDLRLAECSGTWAAPLWLTPDHWEGGGKSGEVDMVELCPTHSVSSNFAGASLPTGQQETWSGVDPDSFAGHVTMWNDDGYVKVKICSSTEASNNGGHCLAVGAAYYPNIYGSYGCTNGHDCMFTFISDIWNGLSGDGGFWGCTGGAPPSTKSCRFSVRDIAVKGPSFSGNCAALTTRRRRTPAPTPTPSPSPVPTPTPTPAGGKCCWGGCSGDCHTDTFCDAAADQCTGNCAGTWCATVVV